MKSYQVKKIPRGSGESGKENEACVAGELVLYLAEIVAETRDWRPVGLQ